MRRPKLGQKIRLSSLDRRQRWKSVPTEINPNDGYIEKYWAVTDSGVVEGVFIGYRTLSNGCRTLHSFGYVYTPKEYFEAWLIVTDPRRRPVFVLPSEVPGLSRDEQGV